MQALSWRLMCSRQAKLSEGGYQRISFTFKANPGQLICSIEAHSSDARTLQVITERAVAVLGNLSTSPEYFQALRDAGELRQPALLTTSNWTAFWTRLFDKNQDWSARA